MYVVVRTCKNVDRKTILHSHITEREEAKRLALSYPVTDKSMVFFDKQELWLNALKRQR